MKGKNSKKEKEEKGKKDVKVKGKNKKEEEEEEVPLPPPEKPANLERFIYVTTYYDSSAMQKIKELFEEINQKAFQLRSVKEIYTRNLTDERGINLYSYTPGDHAWIEAKASTNTIGNSSLKSKLFIIISKFPLLGIKFL